MKYYWCYDLATESNFEDEGPYSIGHIYDSMDREQLLRVFYYAGNCPSKEEFIQQWSSPQFFVYAAYRQDNLLGLLLLNNFTGLSALSHLCYFKAGLDEKLEIAKECMGILRDGGMASLVGLTPKPYRHAINFALSVGYKKVGELQGACYMASHDKYVDGIITTLNLKEI